MPDSMDHLDDEHSEVRKRWKLEEDLREAKAEIKRLNLEVSKAQARADVAIAALDAGVTREGLLDIDNRAAAAGWAMKDGRAVMVNPDGTHRSDIGPSEWVKSLQSSAKHLFTQPDDAKPTQSAGVPGGGGKPIPTGRSNPWSKDGWSDTEQARVYLEQGRDRAEAMAKAVGSYLGALPPK